MRRSWAELKDTRRIPLARELAVSLGGPVTSTSPRAARLVDAVGELVDLLAVPSLLEQHAHRLVTKWQEHRQSTGSRDRPGSPPPGITVVQRQRRAHLEHHAWLVLCDVLAAIRTVRRSPPPRTYPDRTNLRSRRDAPPSPRRRKLPAPPEMTMTTTPDDVGPPGRGAAVNAALDRALCGRRHHVAVCGAEGTGRTHLIEHARRAAARRSMRVLATHRPAT